MQKAFFSCALAIGTSATTQDEADFTPLLAVQIDHGLTLADPTAFGQIDAVNNPEDVEFWSGYLAQVHAAAEMMEQEPYWTDGYTSLSQAEIETLTSQDSAVHRWGKKGGLAQIDSNGHGHALTSTDAGAGANSENFFNDALTWASDTVADVTEMKGMIIDKAKQAIPALADVTTFLKSNPMIKDVVKQLKGVPVGKLVGDIFKGKIPDMKDLDKVMQSVGIDIPDKFVDAANDAAKIFSVLALPDDGKPKTCWIKTATRKFSIGSKCTPDQERGVGGICYAKCPEKQGQGNGPMCLGTCSDKHIVCGPLCILKADKNKIKCEGFMKTATKEVLGAGAQAASGDFVGAIFGGLALASKLTNPICAHWNN